jgi:hypothetical protein
LQDPTIFLPTKNAPIGKEKHRLKVKEWRKLPKIWRPKASGLAILISDEAKFKPKLEEAKKVNSYW